MREKAFIQMDVDAAKTDGLHGKTWRRIPFTDKAAPETIRKEFEMSKNEFKRAVGRLLKEKKIEIREKDNCPCRQINHIRNKQEKERRNADESHRTLRISTNFLK